jgi:hypothetical protein
MMSMDWAVWDALRWRLLAASFCTDDDADNAEALGVEVTHAASTKITRSTGRSEVVVTRNMGDGGGGPTQKRLN